MKKTLLILLGFLWLSSPARAVDYAFEVSATVPAATGIGIKAFKVNSASGVFTPLSTMQLSFDPLKFDAAAGTYGPDHYFVLEATPIGGAAGDSTLTFSFIPGVTPNSNGHGIGYKTTATFVKVTGSGTNTTESPLNAHGPKKLLKDLNGEAILGTETIGGWARVYLGAVTMDPNATYKDPAGSEPFSNNDTPGAYRGTLMISATVR